MRRRKSAKIQEWAPLGGKSLLEDVSEFTSCSVKGYYRDDFDVNSKNWMEMSAGTRVWIEVCNDLLDRCASQVKQSGPSEALCEALESIFELLDRIDDGDDSFLFFADEGGSWQVGVSWIQVLPAWFRCLALTATPEAYDHAVQSALERYQPPALKQLLSQARRIRPPAG